MPQIPINVSSGTDNVVLARDAAVKTQVFEYALYAASAVLVIIKDEAGSEFARYNLVAGSLTAIAVPISGAHRFVAVGDLIINLSSGVLVTGHLTYAQNQ